MSCDSDCRRAENMDVIEGRIADQQRSSATVIIVVEAFVVMNVTVEGVIGGFETVDESKCHWECSQIIRSDRGTINEHKKNRKNNM